MKRSDEYAPRNYTVCGNFKINFPQWRVMKYHYPGECEELGVWFGGHNLGVSKFRGIRVSYYVGMVSYYVGMVVQSCISHL